MKIKYLLLLILFITLVLTAFIVAVLGSKSVIGSAGLGFDEVQKTQTEKLFALHFPNIQTLM